MDPIINAITAAGYVATDALVAKVQEKIGASIPRRTIDKAFKEVRDAEKAALAKTSEPGAAAA